MVIHDTGQVRTWKNTRQKFELIENPNSNFYSYPIGIAVADYDNNGLVDFFFSNVGTTPPHFLVKGNLRDDQPHNWKWLLFQNQSEFKLVDKADEAKLANYEFGWGCGSGFDDQLAERGGRYAAAATVGEKVDPFHFRKQRQQSNQIFQVVDRKLTGFAINEVSEQPPSSGWP